MVKSYPHIFQPIVLGPAKLANRIAVAPAAPFLASHTGGVSPEFYAYTEGLARAGAAVVTIGVSDVNPMTRLGTRTLYAGNDLFLPDLGEIADCIHSHDALANIELVYSKHMLSAPEKVVNETTTQDVEEIIRHFAQAAARCKRAGFDMILLHGGHGNVPAMFFNKKYNHRSDRFGGSFENRCTFGIELLEAVREATAGEVAIEYRISAEEMLPDMTSLEETLAYAQVIQSYIDLLHVSRGLLEESSLLPYINAPIYLQKGLNLPYAAQFKKELKIPITVVGSFDLELAERAIAAGDVDMVSMIRTIIADTHCVDKARRGRSDDIRPCIRCNTCIDRTHTERVGIQCAVNPRIGRETRFETTVAGSAKHVVIVGGGVAGLEAARTSAARGHTVSLLEKDEQLGGLFRLACATELKQELRAYLTWSIRDVLATETIAVHLGTEATSQSIRDLAPDVLLLAIGAKPIIPSFSASGTDRVVWVGDVETDKATVGEQIVIAGAGVTGMELALDLSNKGKAVTLVDLLPQKDIGVGGTTISLICLKDLLAKNGVAFVCESRIIDIDEQGVLVEGTTGARTIIPCDTAILSLGFKPDTASLRQFEGLVEPTYRIGDCSSRGGTLHKATRGAFERSMRV